jgi:hypothetical protein
MCKVYKGLIVQPMDSGDYALNHYFLAAKSNDEAMGVLRCMMDRHVDVGMEGYISNVDNMGWGMLPIVSSEYYVIDQDRWTADFYESFKHYRVNPVLDGIKRTPSWVRVV